MMKFVVNQLPYYGELCPLWTMCSKNAKEHECPRYWDKYKVCSDENPHECEHLFEEKTAHGQLSSENLRKIFRISDGKNLSATNVDAPIIRNARKRFVKPGNTTNRKINILCKS